MNHFHSRYAPLFRILDSDGDSAGDSVEQAPPPHDELDALLRDWHREHADVAAASRAQILASVRAELLGTRSDQRDVIARIGRAMTGRVARIAACIAIVGAIATVLLTPSRNAASASSTINVAEGGELTAFGKDRDRLGPCPLQHTDVDAEVTGPFTRVMLKQRFANPYPQKIEAIYTFPMSHRAAIDHMRIIVNGPTGERVVEGEVKERNAARQMYENARASGYVASLLEQERPNIFTQMVSNIEPGSTVTVEIGYLETLQRKDGVYSFDFPMTVGPRYVPGAVRTGGTQLPDGLLDRAGIVLLGPAQVEVTTVGATFTSQAAQQALAIGVPIRTPTPDWIERNSGATTDFVVTYANGAKESGQIYANGSGHLNDRWFWYGRVGTAGNGFAANTDQVPDASKITPMPVKPSERAGHDVSVRVTIDSGGAAIRDLKSDLHEITSEAGGRTVITLKDKNAIPNRDFMLSWKSDSDLLAPGVYAHMRGADDATKGGYFAVILDPPARVDENDVPPRELVFVLDTSGSMNGFPIEKAKEVMTKAIAAMRPRDTFNVITFAGSTSILWPEARSANDDNKLTAQRFVNERQGGGGTEMMAAINAALKPLDRAGWLRPKELADLPADGRAVRVTAPMTALDQTSTSLDVGEGKSVRVAMNLSLPTVIDAERASKTLSLEGQWVTKGGDRVFAVDRASFERTSIAPTRIVMFLTDGKVANDGAIVQAVRDNARTTRVFSFGIGQSVNRSLLDGIAQEGRGVSEIVTLAENADAAVARFLRRIQSPVLVDIEAKFTGVEVTDVIPDLAKLPDLYDESPLILVGRYARTGTGALTLSGMTGAGRWERTMPVALPERSNERTAVPTLWARAKVESVIAPHRAAIEEQQVDATTHDAIVRLGEAYQIMTPFTSFVAVERSRVTIGGSPMLVQVPIELPEGTSWRGFFGEGVAPAKWFAAQAAWKSDPAYGGADQSLGLLRDKAIDVLASQAGDQAAFYGFFAQPVATLAVDANGDGFAAGAYFRGNLNSGDRGELAPVLRVLGESPRLNGIHRTEVAAAVGGSAWNDRQFTDAPNDAGLVGSLGGYVVSKEKAGGGGGGMGGGSLPGKRATDPAAAPASSPPPPHSLAQPPAAAEGRKHIDVQTPGTTKAPATVAPKEAPTGSTAPASGRRGGVREPIPAPGSASSAPGSNGPTDGTKPVDALKKEEKTPPATDKASDRERAENETAAESEKTQEQRGASAGADELAKKDAEARKPVDEKLPKDPAKLGEASKSAVIERSLTPADRDLLARRVERTLLALALAADIDAGAALDLAKTARPPLSFGDDGTVRVTILLAAGDADATDRMATVLRNVGISIEATNSATRIIVARVHLNAMIDLALRDAIRRIEPFRAKPAVIAAPRGAEGK